MKNQCQHLIEEKHNELMELLQKLKNCYIDPVDFNLKEYAKPVCSIPHPSPKLHKGIF